MSVNSADVCYRIGNADMDYCLNELPDLRGKFLGLVLTLKFDKHLDLGVAKSDLGIRLPGGVGVVCSWSLSVALLVIWVLCLTLEKCA